MRRRRAPSARVRDDAVMPARVCEYPLCNRPAVWPMYLDLDDAQGVTVCAHHAEVMQRRGEGDEDFWRWVVAMLQE